MKPPKIKPPKIKPPKIKPPKIEIPETKGLFQGKFGYYYYDKALTQYAGRVVNNQWIKATPEDVAKEKKNRERREKRKSSTLNKKAATQPAIKTDVKSIQKSHLELVSINLANKVNNVFSTGVNPDGSLVMDDNIPKEYMYRVQDAFGRKDKNTDIELRTADEDYYIGTLQYAAYYRNGFQVYSQYTTPDAVVIDKELARPQINLDVLEEAEYKYLHTLTHETIHSASPRFTAEDYTPEKDQEYSDNPTFVAIEEGLTEYIATSLCRSLVKKHQENTPYTFNRKEAIYYPREVEVIDALVQYGELDPIELFETAKTHQELVRLTEPKQNKFLKFALKQVGFDAETADQLVKISENLAKSTYELIIFEPDYNSKDNKGSRLLPLIYAARRSFKETNRSDSVAHREIYQMFEDNNFSDET
jgi:hypothetical protein